MIDIESLSLLNYFLASAYFVISWNNSSTGIQLFFSTDKSDISLVACDEIYIFQDDKEQRKGVMRAEFVSRVSSANFAITN
jgi:hypothetical protein